MSGYDIEKFDPPPDPDLVCCICQCVLDRAVESPCRHVFCQGCIERWLSNRHTCPTCRERTRKQDLKPVLPLVQNMLNRLIMICDYRDNGCLEKVMLEYYERHVRECGYEMKKCRFPKCGRAVLKMHLERHECGECEHRETLCGGECRLMIPLSDKPTHNCVRALKTHIDEKNAMIETLKTKLQELNSLSQSLSVQLDELRRQLDDNRPRPTLSISSYSSSDTDVTEFMSDDLSQGSLFDENSNDLANSNYNNDDIESIEVSDYDPAADDTTAAPTTSGGARNSEGVTDMVEQVERTVVNSLFDLTSRLERVRHQMRSVLDNGAVYDNNNLNDELHISSAALDAIVNNRPAGSSTPGADNPQATSTSMPDHTYNLRSTRVEAGVSHADSQDDPVDHVQYDHDDDDESRHVSESDISDTNWDSDHDHNQVVSHSGGEESDGNSIPSTTSRHSPPPSSRMSEGTWSGADHSLAGFYSDGSNTDHSYSASTPVPSDHGSQHYRDWAESSVDSMPHHSRDDSALGERSFTSSDTDNNESRDSFSTIHSVSSPNASNSAHSSKYSEIDSSSIPSSPGTPRSFEMSDDENHTKIGTEGEHGSLSTISEVDEASGPEHSAAESYIECENNSTELTGRVESDNHDNSSFSRHESDDDYSSTVNNDSIDGRNSDVEQSGYDGSGNGSDSDNSQHSAAASKQENIGTCNNIQDTGSEIVENNRHFKDDGVSLAQSGTGCYPPACSLIKNTSKRSQSRSRSRSLSPPLDYNTSTEETSPQHGAAEIDEAGSGSRDDVKDCSVLSSDSDSNYSLGRSLTGEVNHNRAVGQDNCDSEHEDESGDPSDNDKYGTRSYNSVKLRSMVDNDDVPRPSATGGHVIPRQHSKPYMYSPTDDNTASGSDPGDASDTAVDIIEISSPVAGDSRTQDDDKSAGASSVTPVTVSSDSSENVSSNKSCKNSMQRTKSKTKSPVHEARTDMSDGSSAVDSGIGSASQSSLQLDTKKETRYDLRSSSVRKRKTEQNKCSSNSESIKKRKTSTVTHSTAHMHSSASQTEQNSAGQNVNVKIDLSLINLSGQLLPQTSTCTNGNATVIQNTANIVPSSTTSRNQKQYDSTFARYTQPPSNTQPPMSNISVGVTAASKTQPRNPLAVKSSSRPSSAGNKQSTTRSRRHALTNPQSYTRGRSPVTSSPINSAVSNREVSGNRDFPNSWRDDSDSDSESSDSTWGPDTDAADTDVTFTEESEVETDSSYEVLIPKSTLGLLDEYTSADTDDTWSAGSPSE